MVLHPSRIIILLFFVGFISVQQERVLGITSLEIVLRQSQQYHRIMLQKNQHFLSAEGRELLNTKKNSANANKGFDPNKSSKRRVRRGSDPIHNMT
ncbi:hypothetical protein Lal_00018408 [Lupinus albus]|uniref:Uncharacterized protein n=1 Tax=Lupinus albus TaxID=3870 RepID=A0A6A5MEY6_LUPAL|nr:hypothetical protein Lalb_Chr04g0256051 [Lupinus albus]KAF1869315.1 hypothetical protein Lal_00018408 [Lupinus albus]